MTGAKSWSVFTLDKDCAYQLEDILSGDGLPASQLDTLPQTIIKPRKLIILSSSSEYLSQMHKNPAEKSTLFGSDLVASSLAVSFSHNQLTLRPAELTTTAQETVYLNAEISQIPLRMQTSSVVNSAFTLEALDGSIAAVGVDLDDILSVAAEESQHQADALSGLQPSAAASHPTTFTCDAQTGQKRKFDQLSTRWTLLDPPLPGSIELTSASEYPSDVLPEPHLFNDSIDHLASYGVFVPEGVELTASAQTPLELANLLEPPQHSKNVEKDAQEIWEDLFRRGIP